MTLAAGFYGITNQAAQVILIYLASMVYTSVIGMRTVCGNMIGINIGQGNVVQARSYLWVIFLFTFITAFFFIFILRYYRTEIISLFTKDEELIQIINDTYYILLISLIPDVCRAMLRSVL